MIRPRVRPTVLLLAAVVLASRGAAAQGFGTSASKPRPWSRVSFFTNLARTSITGVETRQRREMTLSFSYQLPDVDADGVDYGVDARVAMYPETERPDRVSLYEGFVGARLLHGRVRARAGHLWLTDLGSLGSVAGGVVEYRQPRVDQNAGRVRGGAFGGAEPIVLDTGYAPNVRKLGGYVAYDGAGAQRHVLGYVLVRNASLTERSALTMANFLPVGRRTFIYQAAEINLAPPAGLADSGLAYFFANARVLATERLELQGTYNRGRSVDARGLGDDVLSGRPIAPTAIDGLLYESGAGRVTVEVVARLRVYAQYSRDRNNRDTDAINRFLFGGYAPNVAGSGFDITASDALMERASGSFHSVYVSVGRTLGRRVYLIGDYSDSLSVVRYSRGDGLVVETRPHATRVSATVTANLTRELSLLGTLERSSEVDLGETRLLTGLTYRIR